MTHRWITWLAAGVLAACVGRPDVASSPSGEAEQLLGAGQRALAAEELNRARGRFRDAQQVARALDDTDVQLRGLMGELEVALIRGEIETAAELAPTLDALAPSRPGHHASAVRLYAGACRCRAGPQPSRDPTRRNTYTA